MGTLIPIVIKLIQAKPSDEILELKSVLIGLGIPGIVTGIPAILWLWVYFAVRKKNKPLTLQAFVEKKLQFCLNLRFLIKNVDIPHIQKNKEIIILENFESQGTYAPRWLNIQIINVVCSIFPDFNYVFKFNNLSDEEYNELIKVMSYDFRNIELIVNEISDIKEWNLAIKKSNKFPFLKTKNNS